MSVFRINKTNNYTVMSNYHFREKGMSLKAKGLLSLMLSLPEDWDYSVAGLIQLSSDGDTSVRTALQELEKFGYLQRKRIYENGKIIDWEYNIYEMPKQQNLDVENQRQESLILENNNNKIRNKQFTNGLSTKKSSFINKTTTKTSLVKKSNRYEQIKTLIYNFTEDESLRTALHNFVNLQLEIEKETGRKYYANVFKGALKKLKKEFKPSEYLEIVTYAVNRGWKNFYEIPKHTGTSTKSVKNRTSELEVSCERATKEELEYNHRMAMEREARGERGVF